MLFYIIPCRFFFYCCYISLHLLSNKCKITPKPMLYEQSNRERKMAVKKVCLAANAVDTKAITTNNNKNINKTLNVEYTETIDNEMSYMLLIELYGQAKSQSFSS